MSDIRQYKWIDHFGGLYYAVELASGHIIKLALVTDDMPEIHKVLRLPTTVPVPVSLVGTCAAFLPEGCLESFITDASPTKLRDFLRESRRIAGVRK